MRVSNRNIILAILLYTAWSCNDLKEADKDKVQDSTSKAIKSLDKQYSVKNCTLKEEIFEPVSTWPKIVFDPAEDLDGYIQSAADISFAPNEFGLMTYMRKSDSVYFLLFVEVLDAVNKVKVIGTKQILTSTKNISFESFCQTSCEYDYLPLGMFEINSGGKVRTIYAWTIDKNRKVVYSLKPETVYCQEAYEAIYD